MSDVLDDLETEAPRETKRNLSISQHKAKLRAALLGMMEVQDVRAWVWELLKSTHLFQTSFSANPNVTAFREGERNVGLRLFNDLNRDCPEAYALMAKEAHERNNRTG